MWPVVLRQQFQRRDNSQCYDLCNDADLEAQSEGKTPSLCDTNSIYFDYYTGCLACLEDYPSQNISNSLDIAFLQFNDYCESLGIVLPEAITTTVVVTIDNRIVTVPITTVLGATTYVSSTFSSNSTTSSTLKASTSPTLTNPTSSPADTSILGSGSHPQSRAWIAGAAVGSIAGALLVVILPGLLWYYHGRRQMRREINDPFEKPQLHSDCIPRQELEGAQLSELEAPVAELEGTEQLLELPGANEQHLGNGPAS
ncbi:hypothetical protein F5Y12DRAFT_779086 [Xylaria sp. FL1777]|nr:hypothetical protein F5Y12DRAFT_779086 [Xylaria sp. FL1777]